MSCFMSLNHSCIFFSVTELGKFLEIASEIISTLEVTGTYHPIIVTKGYVKG